MSYSPSEAAVEVVARADRNPHDPQARHFRTVYERQHRGAAPSTGSPT